MWTYRIADRDRRWDGCLLNGGSTMRLDQFEPRQTGFGPRVTAMIAVTALLAMAVLVLWKLAAVTG
jgi:hypothetical protein